MLRGTIFTPLFVEKLVYYTAINSIAPTPIILLLVLSQSSVP